MSAAENAIDQGKARETWNAQARDLATKAWTGADCSGSTPAARAGAIIAVADMLLDALPADRDNVNARCVEGAFKSPPPPKSPSLLEKLFKSESQEMTAGAADPSYGQRVEATVGAQNAAPLNVYAKALMRLVEGTGPTERARLLKVGSDYAWRAYCVRFHIPADKQASFPQGDPLLDWDRVHQLYSQARFENGAQMVSFKKTLAMAAMAEAPASSALDDRSSLIDGLSCCYLYDRAELTVGEVKRLSKAAPPDCQGYTSIMSLKTNPLWAFFGPALKAEHGLAGSAEPAAPVATSVDLGKLASRRGGAEPSGPGGPQGPGSSAPGG